MSRFALGQSTGRTWLVLAAMLIAAVVVRLLVVEIPGHSGDVRVIARWAEHMAEQGSIGFYGVSNSIYPAFLYVIWPLGAALDGDALFSAIKALSIPFDLALAVVLVAVFVRRGSPGLGLGAAALYLFNPGTIVAGPLWGQVDSAGTLAFLGALIATAGRHHAAAGALAVLATLFKPQFGLAVLAVGVAALAEAWRERRIGPIAWNAVGGIWMYGMITGPLALSPGRYLELLTDTAERQPMTSLYAFNPWAVIAGFDLPDDPYFGTGLVLLLAGLVVSLLPLGRRRDLATMLAVGGMLAMALYFLPTRVHERYLFPILALLAPVAAAELRLRVPYVVLSCAYALTLIYTLVVIAGLEVPEAVAAVLVTDIAVWVLTITMMAAALTFFIVFLSRGAPAFAPDGAPDADRDEAAVRVPPSTPPAPPARPDAGGR